MTTGAKLSPLFELEHLIEALEKTRGLINSAQRYMKNKWGYTISIEAIHTQIKKEDMQDWLNDIRKLLVEDCMSKTMYKAIQGGDNTCLMWVLDRYKHHIDFLAEKKEDATDKEKGDIVEFMNEQKRADRGDSASKPQAVASVPEQHGKD